MDLNGTWLALGLALAAGPAAPPAARSAKEAAMTRTDDGARDFDFWMGSWRIENRRLRRRLAGCRDWDTFTATGVARPLPGGLGNQDEFRTDFWPGFVGTTYRFHDPVARTWSIFWADNRGHALQPPVVGRFEGDTGIFEGDDVLDDRRIRVRFTWTRGESPRWEQAFSADGGETWEVNWTMVMTRIRLPPPARLEAIELRRYRIVPGERDRFVRRFDAVVPDPFDQLGAPILGQFRVRAIPTGSPGSAASPRTTTSRR